MSPTHMLPVISPALRVTVGQGTSSAFSWFAWLWLCARKLAQVSTLSGGMGQQIYPEQSWQFTFYSCFQLAEY